MYIEMENVISNKNKTKKLTHNLEKGSSVNVLKKEARARSHPHTHTHTRTAAGRRAWQSHTNPRTGNPRPQPRTPAALSDNSSGGRGGFYSPRLARPSLPVRPLDLHPCQATASLAAAAACCLLPTPPDNAWLLAVNAGGRQDRKGRLPLLLITSCPVVRDWWTWCTSTMRGTGSAWPCTEAVRCAGTAFSTCPGGQLVIAMHGRPGLWRPRLPACGRLGIISRLE